MLTHYHNKSDATRLFISLRKQASHHSHIRIITLSMQVENIHTPVFSSINNANTMSVIACLISVPAHHCMTIHDLRNTIIIKKGRTFRSCLIRIF